MGVMMRVSGKYACFTMPALHSERVSYEVMTPSAAVGILKAIYWHKEIEWIIDRIHVLNPIHYMNIKTNDIRVKMSPRRQYITIEDHRLQRNSYVLTNVDYIIEAHFIITAKMVDDPAKYKAIFERRLMKGQCFHVPWLGLREFSANFGPVDKIPVSAIKGERYLGQLFYGFDYESDIKNPQPMFFEATMENGIIEVPQIRRL